MESFNITVDNTDYTVETIDNKDVVLYEIHTDKLICIIGLNEDGQWESDCEFPADIVKKIGEAIENHEA